MPVFAIFRNIVEKNFDSKEIQRKEKGVGSRGPVETSPEKTEKLRDARAKQKQGKRDREMKDGREGTNDPREGGGAGQSEAVEKKGGQVEQNR